MRVDAQQGDGRGYEVFLDGVRLDHCVMADDELGCVEVYEMEPKQRRDGSEMMVPIIDESLPRNFRTRMAWGKVEIQPMGDERG